MFTIHGNELILLGMRKRLKIGISIQNQCIMPNCKQPLEPLQHEPLSVVELLDKLSIRHRASFRTTYLVPALTQNLVEMTLPDKPKSPNQKYRLTAKGRAMLQHIANRARKPV